MRYKFFDKFLIKGVKGPGNRVDLLVASDHQNLLNILVLFKKVR
jgi:hypothetical protein